MIDKEVIDVVVIVVGILTVTKAIDLKCAVLHVHIMLGLLSAIAIRAIIVPK